MSRRHLSAVPRVAGVAGDIERISQRWQPDRRASATNSRKI